MSKDVKGILVTFEKDVSEEMAEVLVQSIQMLKGVLDVSPVPTDMEDFIAYERARHDLKMALYEVLNKKR